MKEKLFKTELKLIISSLEDLIEGIPDTSFQCPASYIKGAIDSLEYAIDAESVCIKK